ncbi:MAG TPA: chromate transporter [Candidatus Aphodomonas merdavium]|nr:chromate transporter [Candidatus Aphodomonas merdavium]
MVFVELFTVFALIGVTSFGGMSMVPLINAQMISHGWMSATEVLDIVAIAEMTPGSLGFNCATFAGMRVAGILGAAVANLGVLAPTFTITLAAGMFMRKFQNSRYLQEAMYGIRPVCIGLLVSTIFTMLDGTIVVSGAFCWQSAVVVVVISLLLARTKLGVPALIAIAAAMGLLLF